MCNLAQFKSLHLCGLQDTNYSLNINLTHS
nr:MAG TPA: hypothetical protein [Bacteriophage sp.]